MKPRSPVLGYNHNVRYAGRLWHVQTEDSGVNNPHIFTHLFHDGTILATKRVDYDPSSEVGVGAEADAGAAQGDAARSEAGRVRRQDHALLRSAGRARARGRDRSGRADLGRVRFGAEDRSVDERAVPRGIVAARDPPPPAARRRRAWRRRPRRRRRAPPRRRRRRTRPRHPAGRRAVAAEPDAVAAGDSRRRVALGHAARSRRRRRARR